MSTCERRWALGLCLALLPACSDNCRYEGPDGGFIVEAGETASGDASFTRTPFSFAYRYDGYAVDGAPRTGFVSVFVEQPVGVDGFEWGNPANWPRRGRVVSMQGHFATTYPDWLCRTLELKRVGTAMRNEIEDVCIVIDPDRDDAECAEPAFASVTTNIFSYGEIFEREVAEPDVFTTSDGCGDEAR